VTEYDDENHVNIEYDIGNIIAIHTLLQDVRIHTTNSKANSKVYII